MSCLPRPWLPCDAGMEAGVRCLETSQAETEELEIHLDGRFCHKESPGQDKGQADMLRIPVDRIRQVGSSRIPLHDVLAVSGPRLPHWNTSRLTRPCLSSN